MRASTIVMVVLAGVFGLLAVFVAQAWLSRQDEQLRLKLLALPSQQMRQHGPQRGVQRLHLRALHRAGAVAHDDEMQGAPGHAAPRHQRIAYHVGAFLPG